jgi:CDP-diacylglycerol--glycerol-3-phosphate 3-phosphatidyltransferase
MSERKNSSQPVPGKPEKPSTGLYRLKGRFTRLLTPLISFALQRKISPNVFTAIGVLGGAFAGFGLATVHTWWVFIGVVIRLAGANLDGAVARAAKRESRHGFWINEVGDRLGDWAIFAGLLWMPQPASVSVWISVMVAVALPTAVSLWGVRRRVARINGGPFGKTERCLFAVVFVALVQLVHIDATVQGYFLQVLIWASLVTALIRWQRIQSR